MNVTLLIAEDEKVERQALRLMISRYLPQIEILDDAVNGIDMIQKVDREQPDIVITDIEMPGINGLDAIETLKQKGFKGKIIVQTAYSQFDYARQAIAVDAEAYLLKPIKKEALLSLLQETIRKIRNEMADQEETERYQTIFRQMRPILDHELLFSVQINEMQTSFIEPYLHQVLPGLSYTVMTISLADSNSAYDGKNLNSEHLSTVVRELMSTGETAICGLPVNGRQSIIISHPVEDPYKTRIESILCAEYILDEINTKIETSHPRIGIGRSVSRIQDLHRCFKESLLSLKSGAMTGIQHFGDMETSEISDETFNIPVQELQDAVLKGNRDEANQILDKFIQLERVHKSPLADMKDALISIVLEISRERAVMSGAKLQQIDIMSRYLRDLSHCTTEQETLNWFRNELLVLAEAQEKQNRNRIHSCVRKAQEYIERNFMRDISLDLVAEEIGISPYHLSHLFRQELDQNYIKYLTGVRIKQAERLLAEEKYSLGELARLSGYNNAPYFARVFSKQTGQVLKEKNGICHCVPVI